jgi:hypothetical protein
LVQIIAITSTRDNKAFLRKEETMETANKEEKEATIKEEKKGKRKWGSLIFNFLVYGGWLLVAFVVLGIIILISALSK